MKKSVFASLLIALLLTGTAWAGPSFELLQFTEYPSWDLDWQARGIIKNVGDQRAYFVKVYADLYKKGTDEFVETEYGYVNGTTALTRYSMPVDTTVAPGEWVTWEILFADSSYGDVEPRNIRVVYDVYEECPSTKAQLQVTQFNQRPDYWGDWEGYGIIQNTGPVIAGFVEIHCDLFSLKNEDDGFQEYNYYYLGNAWTYVNGQQGTTPSGTETDTILNPGAEGTFETAFSSTDFDQVRYARSTINWNEYSSQASAYAAASTAGPPPNKYESRESWESYNQLQNTLEQSSPGAKEIQLLD